MKELSLFLLLSTICIIASISGAHAARIPVFYGNGLEFEELQQLPDSVVSDAGNKITFGLSFEQFSIFSVPLWNYGVIEYAVYEDAIETIYYIDNETAQEFADKYQFTLSEEPTLSFWNKIGGKLIGGALIIILIYFYTRRSKASDKEDSE